MRLNRPLIATAYLVALGLILVPMAETVLSVWPLQVGTVSWRFGAAGMFSRGLLTSLLGLVLAGGMAFNAGHRRVLRMLAVLCGVASIGFLGGAALLTLDAAQLRANVNPDAKTGYNLAALSALLKFLHGFLVTALMAWGGWVASRRGEPSATGTARIATVAFRARGTRADEPDPAAGSNSVTP